MQPAPGILVTRHVELVRPLGKGGMGSVWIGRHTMLETEVAVKFIAPEHAAKDRFVARFRREASSAAKIKSPHVVQVFDHGVTEDGVPYIVMELLGGESLSARLRRERRISPREAAMLVSQVAKVLTTAHEMGIVHRDLKPDNLFLVESGYELFVKVLDFGIAKQLASEDLKEITDTGAMVGTPYYMSPEMLLSPKDADRRADLWAIAVVAYHALTGGLPFRGETLAALSVAINDGTFKPPSATVPDLGPEIDVWFKLALCRNIDGRFQSAGDLAQAFRQAVMVSGDISADRSRDSLSDDSMPRTARPSSDPAFIPPPASSTMERAATTPDPHADPPPREATGEPTVTSEQLARISRGRDDDLDSLPLEETAEAHRTKDSGRTKDSSRTKDSGQTKGDGHGDEAPGAEESEEPPPMLPTQAAGEHSTLEGTTAGGETTRSRASIALALAAVVGVGAIAAVALWPPEKAQAPAVTASTSAAASSASAPEPEAQSASATVSAPAPIAPTTLSSAAPSASAVVPKIVPHRVDPKPPSSAPPAKPAYCTTSPFIVGANGELIPRDECFREP